MQHQIEYSIDRDAEYGLLLKQLKAVLDGISFVPSILSTVACLLTRQLSAVYWAGFYLESDGRLNIGPYQGTMGCLTISPDKGVCGRAYRTQQTQVVEDVHSDPEHIACDAASNAEIVIPICRKDGSIFGVLDIDSITKGRFNQRDAIHLEKIVKRFIEPYVD